MTYGTRDSVEYVLRASMQDDWCLCLFFSVDIEGATAYKTKAKSDKAVEDWCHLFNAFYVNFPAYFCEEYSILSANVATREIQSHFLPALWKFAGDEILFYVPLTDSGQTLGHLRSFHQAIVRYNNFLKTQDTQVQCKGSVWCAGFPVNNRIIHVPKDSTVDFIGSSIDCGFRLTKFSSPRKLVISLDLLWILAVAFNTYSDAGIFSSICNQIYYDGDHELKGVLGGKPYPVFWVDTFQHTPVEEKWKPKREKCECTDIISFCEKFANDTNSTDFIQPFILNDLSKLFHTVPPLFEKAKESLKKYRETLLQNEKEVLCQYSSSSRHFESGEAYPLENVTSDNNKG